MNLPAPTPELSPLSVILCADIGTSALKAAFIDTNGKLLAFCREPYSRLPAVSSGPPACWLSAFFRALDNLVFQHPGIRPGAVVISGNGPTLVPVLHDGKSAAPLHWFSAPSCPPEFTGGKSFFLPSVAAYKNGSPESFKKTKLFLSSQEWLSYTLGAEPVTVLPQEAYRRFYWDAGQCEKAGLDPDMFPPFAAMGSRIGKISAVRLSEEAAQGTAKHIPIDAPVIAGGPDFIMALLGSAVIEPGMICDRTGSSEGINLCVDEQDYRRIQAGFAAETSAGDRESGEIRLLPHARQGFFNAGIVFPESGSLFEKYRRDSGQADKPYDVLMEEISRDSRHEARAVLDAIAFRVKAALEKFRAAGLVPFPLPAPVQMTVSGGQAKYPLWNGIKAKVTGAVILVPEIPDGELAGDAALGALYLRGGSLEETIRRMVRIQDRFDP
ncbi:MAG: sugar kinase [Treponema sp.]|jgi:sugar (pentulose or hexulose) kinase|nr:sugar kinase [Treponema sp.]